MRTAYDLLMTAPDDQITRCQLAHRAIGAGDWADAAHFLRNAARECAGQTWGQDAAALASFCQARVATGAAPRA
ncbi:hypothetical protein RAS12_30725 (plasmid) [Achromobacter seleniivolatilans]|uniref:Bacterial transcriptional activator domain-containing protein n=1 Tax=Achromobacter seleniivolatilans TaxID=3047478 RepID=A0ABY9MAJ4_9BURK|nr:hypothetical protein [Achromobacter sp. R39]WMD24009.1 hypothetical protein RAS12_30725 [Achromobacter sp. R39]